MKKILLFCIIVVVLIGCTGKNKESDFFKPGITKDFATKIAKEHDRVVLSMDDGQSGLHAMRIDTMIVGGVQAVSLLLFEGDVKEAVVQTYVVDAQNALGYFLGLYGKYDEKGETVVMESILNEYKWQKGSYEISVIPNSKNNFAIVYIHKKDREQYKNVFRF